MRQFEFLTSAAGRLIGRRTAPAAGPDDGAGLALPEPASGRTQKNTLYLAILLGGFALIGGALLASGHRLTWVEIEQRHKEDLLSSLAMVMPARLYDNDPVASRYEITVAEGDVRTIYPAKSGDDVAAVAYQVNGKGYGGTIVILVGIDRTGELLGVRVLQHAETPGLGDKIEARKDDWILGFDGLSLENTPLRDWAVKKDKGRFDQFSGATITPRAVVDAVRVGLEFFRDHRNRLLSDS